MIVEQIWTGNSLRNFNYLLACPHSGEALAIDPLDHQKCLALARQRGWEITRVVNTHEHADHIGGNDAVVAATGAKIMAHAAAAPAISGMDRALAAGDVIEFGAVRLTALDTPGHTMSHVCLLAEGDAPALFCGDTLFNAGAGNCHNGGHPAALYRTFIEQLSTLPDHTRIYPGHDYLESNLRFTLDREPGNAAAAAMLEMAAAQDPNHAHVTTVGQERQINTFFRLTNPEVIERLRDQFPDLATHPDMEAVFLKLRELRNHW